jgi:hypothetical protein
MVAKEFFVNDHNFNPIWVQHASILVKKKSTGTQIKKGIRQGFSPGLEPEPEPEPAGAAIRICGSVEPAFLKFYACYFTFEGTLTSLFNEKSH